MRKDYTMIVLDQKDQKIEVFCKNSDVKAKNIGENMVEVTMTGQIVSVTTKKDVSTL